MNLLTKIGFPEKDMHIRDGKIFVPAYILADFLEVDPSQLRGYIKRSKHYPCHRDMLLENHRTVTGLRAAYLIDEKQAIASILVAKSEKATKLKMLFIEMLLSPTYVEYIPYNKEMYSSSLAQIDGAINKLSSLRKHIVQGKEGIRESGV